MTLFLLRVAIDDETQIPRFGEQEMGRARQKKGVVSIATL
jgi:hypothetical protein